MKSNPQPKILKPLSLIFLLLIYLLLCSQFILKQVSNPEASNYLNFFQLSPNEQAPSAPYRNFFPNNVYFGSLKLWAQVFGTTLTSFRSFSILCGAFIIFILFFIFKNKLDTKNMLSIISISALNPVFIHFATEFDPVMALLLGMSIFYLIMILLYRLKLQELISFRHRRPIVNWRSIALSDSPPSRAKTLFTLVLSIFAIVFIVSTLLVGLKQDISIRKIFAAIYQSDHSEQIELSQSSQADQSSQANQPEKSTPAVYIVQTPSMSIYVENLLVAKELNKTPITLSWQDALDRSISTKNLPVKFWIVSFKDQKIDDVQKFLSSQDSSKTESAKKDLALYQETESLKIDDISAKYFKITKGKNGHV
jgi:membrane protein